MNHSEHSLYSMHLDINKPYKKLINKYLEIAVILFVIFLVKTENPTFVDYVIYVIAGITFNRLVLKYLIKIY